MSARNSREGKARRRAERAAQQARIVQARTAEPEPEPLADAARTLADVAQNAERVALLVGKLRRLLGDDRPIADAYSALAAPEQPEARGLMQELHDLGIADYARRPALRAGAAGPGVTALDALAQMTPGQRREVAEIVGRRGKAGGQ